jgi:uncharacterized membrane protein YeaQ/YmgE (transglycosylase-associated protein family)
MITIAVIVFGAGAVGVIASIVMARAANQSALFNMVIGAVLALAVLAGALLIALLMTRAYLPH